MKITHKQTYFPSCVDDKAFNDINSYFAYYYSYIRNYVYLNVDRLNLSDTFSTKNRAESYTYTDSDTDTNPYI